LAAAILFTQAHVFADTPGKYGYTVIKAALEPEWNETIVLDLPSTVSFVLGYTV
jgi:hypothetical protein